MRRCRHQPCEDDECGRDSAPQLAGEDDDNAYHWQVGPDPWLLPTLTNQRDGPRKQGSDPHRSETQQPLEPTGVCISSCPRGQKPLPDLGIGVAERLDRESEDSIPDLGTAIFEV